MVAVFLRTALLLAPCFSAPQSQHPAWRGRAAQRSRVIASATPPPPPGADEPPPGADEPPPLPPPASSREADATSQALNDELRRREESEACPGLGEFNVELYEHLRRRPEFADKALYTELSSRVDVAEEVFKSWRDKVNSTVRLQPQAGQTPGEVVGLVLRALQDCDYPHDGHGVDVLQSFSSDVCVASRAKISAEMLHRYIKGSKFRILLEWVAIHYSKKLETSLEGRRAYQELRLKSSASGDWSSVNFMLGATDDGRWLIDHIRVRGVTAGMNDDFDDYDDDDDGSADGGAPPAVE
ncbi:hypothetical protein KFE25_003607 [Diacronema lutheri]|uniref:Uncharacterized protein n=1 Tax=Diacronema lutheri TaxID=2081491 RepID=A0A8J5XCC9_DIALT|nr:hypothetical protein KFE25_003607 [Diacronema lutheri]